MTIETAKELLLEASVSVDESIDQMVLLPELFLLLNQYEQKQEKDKEILQSIRYKIKDCLIRYKDNQAVMNALTQLNTILFKVYT